MRLLADESVDGPVVLRLRHDGHEVAWVAEDAPGATDDVVLARAYGEGAILLTSDKDFGELVYRQRRPHAGVLLLRLAGLDEASKGELVSRAIGERGADLAGAFSVLDGAALRIRKDPGA
jgi:predicted nuclease of predicted toxin-antitoxin system